MCRKVKCTGCGLATWQGCGLHIDSALNGVAECDRCCGWQTGVCQPATADDTTGDTTGEIKKEEEEEMAIPTNITPEYLESKIRAAFNKLTHPITTIEISDTSDGCGGKFVVLIVTDNFEGIKRLQRHRMINGAEGCLAKEMENIHAMTLKLHTVQEYEKKQAKKKSAAE